MGIDTGDWEHMWLLTVSLAVTVMLGAAVAYFVQDLQTNWRGIVRGVRGAAVKWPLHPWQLGAAFVIAINTVAFYGVVAKSLTNNYSTWAAAGGGWFWDFLTYLHVAAAIAFWFLLIFLELYDPSAEGFTQEEIDQRNLDKAAGGKADESTKLLVDKELFRTTTTEKVTLTEADWTAAHPWCFCGDTKDLKRCNKFYAGRYRYHCRSCNRCTTGFDHHCRYLNQCISTANYRPWVCFIVALFVQSLTQAIVSITTIVAASGDDIDVELGKWGMSTVVILSVLCMLIEVIGTGFTLQLIGIHSELMRLQYTTGKYVTTRSWWGNPFDDGKHAEQLEMAIWQLFRAQDAHRQLKLEEAAAAGEDAPDEDLDKTGFEEIRASLPVAEAYKGDKDEAKPDSGRVFGKDVVDPQEVVRRWLINMKHNMEVDDIKRVQSDRADDQAASRFGFGWLLRLVLGDDSIEEDLYHDDATELKRVDTQK